MKKITVLLLVLALMLCACGTKPENLGGTITPPTTEATAEPTTEPTTPTTGNAVSMGRIEGGTYSNAYTGFAMDLDSTWVYSSAEELQELPDNIKDILQDTDLGDATNLNQLVQFTDMLAESAEKMASINVLYQKMDLQTRLLYAMMSEEDILDATLAQKDLMISSYTQMGLESVNIEKVSVDFLGEKHFALKTTATTMGIPVYMVQIFDYHLGQYSVTTTFTCYVQDITQDLLNLCYPIA